MVLDRFLSTLVYELSAFLLEHKDFFSKKERDALVEKTKFPKPVKAYLAKVSDKDFMSDLKTLVSFLINPSQANPKNNKLMEAVASFLTQDLSGKLYHLDSDYAKVSRKKQTEIVKALIKSDTTLGSALKDIFLNNSHQEIYEAISNFSQSVSDSPYVIVQTPAEIDAKFKKEIRTQLNEDLKTECFPIYQVNKNLIGGLRIFINGKVTDNSWLGRINFITQIKN